MLNPVIENMASDMEDAKPTEFGSAFPLTTIDGYVSVGMALRDYFAAHTLPALLADHTLKLDLKFINKFTEAAYAYADAMLLARGNK